MKFVLITFYLQLVYPVKYNKLRMRHASDSYHSKQNRKIYIMSIYMQIYNKRTFSQQNIAQFYSVVHTQKLDIETKQRFRYCLSLAGVQSKGKPPRLCLV